MTDTALMERRVAEGAATLDEIRPGWEREINLSGLDMSQGGLKDSERRHGCIGAQLDHMERPHKDGWSFYLRGLRRLGITRFISLGFEQGERGDYPTLTKLWAREIRRRRRASA